MCPSAHGHPVLDDNNLCKQYQVTKVAAQSKPPIPCSSQAQGIPPRRVAINIAQTRFNIDGGAMATAVLPSCAQSAAHAYTVCGTCLAARGLRHMPHTFCKSPGSSRGHVDLAVSSTVTCQLSQCQPSAKPLQPSQQS